MKKTLLFILFVLSFNKSFSQEIVPPLISKSFGLNHHTNRDIAYFSHVDSEKNLIVIGTTEKDSTFTDILTLKLDKENNLIWQKKHSIETNLSYDIPLKSYINSNDEIYIIGRSSFNQSYSNGLIFIIKYNKDGNIIYNKTLGNINGTEFLDFGYFDSELNADGSLNVVYSPNNYQSGTTPHLFKFLKFSADGELLNSFSKEIIKQDIIGKIISDNFYFFIREIDITWTNIKYKIYKIDASGNLSVNDVNNQDFNKYYAGAFHFSDDLRLSINNGNFFLVCNNQSQFETNKKLNITKINSNGEVVYSKTTPDNEEYRLVDLFINQQEEAIAIANNLKTNSTHFFKVNDLMQLESISTLNDFLSTGFKQNNDRSFYLTTSNSNINLFSPEINFINAFTNSNTYSLVDFSKIDNNNTLTIGTKYDKMFPESDFFTQLDIIVEKIDNTKVKSNYRYSGIGTSGTIHNRLIIDNDNNYLVLTTEQMGPEYLGIGGVDPPLSNKIIKYDSNLNIIWEIEVPNNIINIIGHMGSPNNFYLDDNNNLYLILPVLGNDSLLRYNLYKVTPDGQFDFVNKSYIPNKFYTNETSIFLAQTYFLNNDSTIFYILDKLNGNIKKEINLGHEEVIEIFNLGSDYFFYTNKSTFSNHIISFYKNGNKQFSREIDNEGYGIHPTLVDKNGTLYFSNGGKLCRLDPNNSFKTYTSGRIHRIIKFNNGNLFVYLDSFNTLILDENLKFITNGDYINEAWNANLTTWGNYILFGDMYDKSIRVINQNGTVFKHFKTNAIFDKYSSKFDKNGNLIMVGTFGNGIYLLNEYRWSRGFINNYGKIDFCPNLTPGAELDAFGCAQSQLDDDKDGVMNDKDLCLKTPLGAIVDFKGCAILPPNNFTIEITNPTCKNNNGNIKITANQSHTYIVTLNNMSNTFTGNIFQQFNLDPKTYTLCIKVPALDNYEQCFSVEIKKAAELGARFSLETKGYTTEAIIEIESGTEPFYIEVNGIIKALTYQDRISVPVKHGDEIIVKSSLLCEGTYTERIASLTTLTTYPNPVKEDTEIYIPEEYLKGPITIQLLNGVGKTLYHQKYSNLNSNTIQVPMKQYPSGIYYIQLKNDKIHTIKVIKQ